jgi:hypothetical protein
MYIYTIIYFKDTKIAVFFFFMAIFYQGRKYGHWLIHNPVYIGKYVSTFVKGKTTRGLQGD